MSDVSGAMTEDPYGEPGSDAGDTSISATTPPGSNVVLHDDGSATIMPSQDEKPPQAGDHFENLAEVLDPSRLNEIARDFIEAVDIDIEARKQRDKQYAIGMRRTGLGDDAPGGATLTNGSGAPPVLRPICGDPPRAGTRHQPHRNCSRLRHIRNAAWPDPSDTSTRENDRADQSRACGKSKGFPQDF